jgi:hypothetical protein
MDNAVYIIHATSIHFIIFTKQSQSRTSLETKKQSKYDKKYLYNRINDNSQE